MRRPVRLPAELNAPVIAAWTRRTLNLNRGVALVCAPPTGPAPAPAFAARLALGKALGRIPFIYGLGLQLVVVGPGAIERTPDLGPFVDRYDNQRCVVQSVHVVDESSHKRLSGRTWGQRITGPFIDSLEAVLDAHLAGRNDSSPAPQRLPVQ